MKIEANIKCDECGEYCKHVVRTKLDAGLYIQLQVACQECGEHRVGWFYKEFYQELFIRKL